MNLDSHLCGCQVPSSASHQPGPGEGAFMLQSLKRCRLPIAAWIARRYIAAIEAPNRLAAAELVVVVHRDKVVTAFPQPVERCRWETVLAADLKTLHPAESGAVAGRLRILAVVGDARQHLHVTLRLHRAAHHAEAHHRCPVSGHKAGNDRV